MMRMKYIWWLLGLGIAGCQSAAQLADSALKVDLNMSGRNLQEVTAFGYLPWEVRSGGPDTLDTPKAKFIICSGNPGRSLTPSWYKAGVRGPQKARFSDDGLTIDNQNGSADTGPEAIELRIRGLNPGPHTLITYHNIIDQVDAGTQAAVDIFVNGKKVKDHLLPTIRATKVTDCAFAVLKLNAQKNKEIVVRFVMATDAKATYRKIVINGFQMDGINPASQAQAPLPVDREEHIMADKNGGYKLTWKAADSTVSHDIYFGTDSLAVANADHGSDCFQGNQKAADTAFLVSDLYSLSTYYWRVDELRSSGNAKGNVWEFRTRQLAFPGAEGYGRFARGGRGGSIVIVSNLNDSGPGSFREAITNDIGPRTIVFNVGGVIELKSRLVLSQPYVTVAGQTAPGKGICIMSAPFGVTGNDDVVRFVRVRIGDGRTYDGMGLTGADNSIIDHCSISWTIDESFSSRGAHNITLQRTLISEALNAAGHKNYPKGKEHGFAATIGGDVGSFHHNLLADCYGRNWSLGGGLVDGKYGGRMDITNNVVYNWGHRATDGGAAEVNFVNNYYKPGAGTDFFYAYNAQHEGYGFDGSMQRCYFTGNVMPGYFDENSQEKGREATGYKVKYDTYVDQPFFPSYVTTQSAHDAYKNVLSDVGCNSAGLDQHDQRIIWETRTGTTSVVGSVTHKKGFPDKVADAGGYESYPTVKRANTWDSDKDGLPDWWEMANGMNAHSQAGDMTDSHADTDKDGFTNMDQYLNWLAEAHYSDPEGKDMQIDLRQLAMGYDSLAQFTVSGAKNGTVQLDSKGIATFSPIRKGAAGGNITPQIGGFEFTVKDAGGSTMTRKVNVAIGVDLDQNQ